MSGPFDKELEVITSQYTQDFARKLAAEVQNLILRKLGIDQTSAASSSASPGVAAQKKPTPAKKPAAPAPKAAAPAPAPKAAAPAKKAAPPPAPAKAKRSNGEDKASIVDKVFRIVSSREGVAVGDVVKTTGLERGSVAAALKALKEEGRIYMGGNRRFARYATSQAAADRASETARKG